MDAVSCSIAPNDWSLLDWRYVLVHNSYGRQIQAQYAPLPGHDAFSGGWCSSVASFECWAGADMGLRFMASLALMLACRCAAADEVWVMHWKVGRIHCTFKVRIRRGWADLREFLAQVSYKLPASACCAVHAVSEPVYLRCRRGWGAEELASVPNSSAGRPSSFFCRMRTVLRCLCAARASASTSSCCG